MQCNIDDRGRRARRIGGWVCCVAGAACLFFAFGPVIRYVPLFVGIGLLAGGTFQLFEARAGWCALRAMGVKTRV